MVFVLLLNLFSLVYISSIINIWRITNSLIITAQKKIKINLKFIFSHILEKKIFPRLLKKIS
jgi:hypothetical protein